MNRHIKFFKHINYKTVYFNLRYLPLKTALKLPIIVSKRVILSKTKGHIEIKSPIETGMIRIGFGDIGIFDKKRSRSIWQVEGRVTFKGRVNICHGCKISVNKDAQVEFGNNFTVTAETEIVSQKRIVFGDNVLVSWDCLIMDTDFHRIYDSAGIISNSPRSIIIGDNVWIGCRSVILKGSRISSGSVVGANSFLCTDISGESGIFVGNPARLVKKNICWQQ